MKRFIILIVCITILGANVNVNGHRFKRQSGCDQSKELTIVPDTGCTKYFKCVNGNTAQLLCPIGS